MQLSFLFLALGMLFGTVHGIETSVAAEIDGQRAFENRLLPGTLTITHDSNQKVDPASVLLENKPLKVELLRVVPLPPGTGELTLYSFEIPAKPKGLYLLPSISVVVGGKRYSTIGSSYQVAAESSFGGGQGISAPQPTQPASLKLEAWVDGLTSLYPGQRTRLVYRILFTGDIELTSETLPLLDATGFEKIGDFQVDQSMQGNVNIQQIVQEVQALKPGIFSFPASRIEGFAYTESATKQRSYIKPKLVAVAPALSLTVMPFPSKGRPVSFKGAVGEYTITTTLLSSPNAYVDDKMQLSIQVTGLGDLRTVSMPDISNFRPFFRLGDLPTVGQVQGNIKSFLVEISPLSTAVQEVPGVELTVFNPLIGVYTTVKSEPIPITVKSRPTQLPPETSTTPIPLTPPAAVTPVLPPPSNPPPAAQAHPPTPPTPPAHPEEKTPLSVHAIEIQTIEPLTPHSLYSLPFGTWSVFWLIPIGIALLIAQWVFKGYLERRRGHVREQKSGDLWKEAWRAPKDSPERYRLMNDAFLKRLVERGEINSEKISPEQLSKTGTPGRVRELLAALEAQRFSGQTGASADLLFEKAQQLFQELGNKL